MVFTEGPFTGGGKFDRINARLAGRRGRGSKMDGKELSAYCLSKKGAAEDFPFGPDVLVMKVASNMFALISMRGNKLTLSLKCDPFLAEDLRQQHPAITAGYHLNKKHWNTISVDGTISDHDIFWMVDHSYEIVLKSLNRAEREPL